MGVRVKRKILGVIAQHWTKSPPTFVRYLRQTIFKIPNNLKHMQKIILLFLTFFVSYYAWAQNPNPSTSVDNFILNEMNLEKIPGISTLIVKNGEIVWRESYGMADIANNSPVTENTIFMLASISKLFTGTALMQLAEDGMIDLDDPINNYLPFDIDVPNFPATNITFRMLMTHTASINDNGPVMDTYYSVGDPTISLADLIQRYFDVNGSDYSATGNFTNQQAGTSYFYTNMGTALAGYMVEVVTGMPFDQYCEEHIFQPLAMDDTSWFLAGLDINQVAVPYQWTGSQFQAYDQYGFADYPNGQLRMSILDMANYMVAFLQNGTICGNEILSSSAVNEMLSLQVPSLNQTQGLNWYTEEVNLYAGGSVTLWGHNGGEDGVSTDMYLNPSNGIGVAVLTNGEGDNSFIIEELYDYALTLSSGNTPDCSGACAYDLSLSNFPASPNLYEASHSIESSGVINTGQNIEITAGNHMLLEPGFEVKSGAEFHAYIQGCQ